MPAARICATAARRAMSAADSTVFQNGSFAVNLACRRRDVQNAGASGRPAGVVLGEGPVNVVPIVGVRVDEIPIRGAVYGAVAGGDDRLMVVHPIVVEVVEHDVALGGIVGHRLTRRDAIVRRAVNNTAQVWRAKDAAVLCL